MNNTFFKPVLRADVGKTAAQRGLLPGQLVYLLVEVSGEGVSAGTRTLSDAGTSGKTFLRHRLQNHNLPSTGESDQTVIGALKFQDQCKTLPYPYSFDKSDEVPETLSEVYTSGFCAWDSRAVRLLSASASLNPASSASPHSSVATDVESGLQDVRLCFKK